VNPNVRRSPAHEDSGDLMHVDINKLVRLPLGDGLRCLGRAAGREKRRAGTVHAYLHHAADDHSRLACSEILTDAMTGTATAIRLRAEALFVAHGITGKAVLPDSGAAVPGPAPRPLRPAAPRNAPELLTYPAERAGPGRTVFPCTSGHPRRSSRHSLGCFRCSGTGIILPGSR